MLTTTPIGQHRLFGLYRVTPTGPSTEETERLRMAEAYPAAEAARQFVKDIANAFLRGEYWDIRPLSNEEVAWYREFTRMLAGLARQSAA